MGRKPDCIPLCFTRTMTSPVAERFYAKVDKSDDGCWIWTASSGTKTGYGRFWDGTRFWVAHRYAYTLAYGPIRDGYSVSQTCRNPRCVNPAHLESLPQHTLRERTWERHYWSRQTCKYGHPWTPENTAFRGRGRVCRKCCALRAREVYRSTHAAVDHTRCRNGHLKEEFTYISPQGARCRQCQRDANRRSYESGAIARYLAKKRRQLSSAASNPVTCEAASAINPVHHQSTPESQTANGAPANAIQIDVHQGQCTR